MKELEKYTFGIGDRFTLQGKAQLSAIIRANSAGIPLAPVWNKSNREHQIVKTEPSDTFNEAVNAVSALNYQGAWYVDADHINLGNVDKFIQHSDFFTLDVADFIGKEADEDEANGMKKRLDTFRGKLEIPGISEQFDITDTLISEVVSKFYLAIKEAAMIYHHIVDGRGDENFVAEVSMDEVDEAQTPVELFFILIMIGHFGIPAQTIAPKFTGRFNKGVDYVGDVDLFRKEFEQDLLVIDFVTSAFGLPANLKLSVHSGSDKFSIYPVIGELIRKHDKGIHIKTAGTTWLEEVIGLAMAGGEALDMAKYIYTSAYKRMDELCKPYSTVIDIDSNKLPTPEAVATWSREKFANTLRHIPGHPDYDPMFRQLIHVGYKVAAELGEKYVAAIQKNSEIVGKQVEENIYERHVMRLWEADKF